MQIGEIEVRPIAAESMGIRSLCTTVTTPDITILFDPSAALARRYRLEPHPVEYRRLETYLQRIFVEARKADVLSISHYHYDHVRPGFTNFRYNFSSKEELQRMYEGKRILAKDSREKINASQRRRAYYFQRDVEHIANEIVWADGEQFEYGETSVVYSPPVPHGPEGTFLGYVLMTSITHAGTTFVFAPDVQGPVSKVTLSKILELKPTLVIVGGPPLYINKFTEKERKASLHALEELAMRIQYLVIDHHICRTQGFREWLRPVIQTAEESGNCVLTMAQLAGVPESYLEIERKERYRASPPSEEFINWTNATDEYKLKTKPPI